MARSATTRVKTAASNNNADVAIKSHPTSFWLDDETKATLERLMEELGTSRSEVVREAIKRMGGDDRSNEIRKLVNRLSEIA